MKRLFAWMIISLMSLTAVMPSFVSTQKEEQTPSVVQVDSEEKTDNVIPDVTPDPEPEEEDSLGDVIDYSNAISSTAALNNYVAQKTEELNQNYLSSITVSSDSEDYRNLPQ